MQNSIAKPSQPARDGLDCVEVEGDATDEEMLVGAANRLLARFIFGLRRIPKRGRVVLDWDAKDKGGKRRYIVTAKNETVDHDVAEVRKKV